jgi:peptidoglycan/LPS O-acetylase OafA/YrhL
MVTLRVAIGLFVGLSIVYGTVTPFEMAVNYVVLTWGTQYVWPIAVYSGAALLLFVVLGGVLSALAGVRRAAVLLPAVFGFGCMIFLVVRQPFFSIAPTPPTPGQIALAYMHTLMAPLGAVLGASIVGRFIRRRRGTRPNTSPERAREG